METYENLNPSEKEIKALLISAKSRIQSAKILVENKQYRDAISRSYYAFLDSARAALLSKGKFAKTHAGTLTLFGLEFDKNKKIPPQLVKFYRKIKEAREEADYQFLREFSEEEAKESIKMAEEFVNYIEKNIVK